MSEADLAELLSGAAEECPAPTLHAVTKRLAERCDAGLAYLAVGMDSGVAEPSWWYSWPPNHQARPLQAAVSTTLLRRSLEEGVVQTFDARTDPRFSAAGSVQKHNIRAVLCAAIEDPAGSGPLGVLCLQGADGRGPFTPEHTELLRLTAMQLAPILQRLLWSLRMESVDHTTSLRSRLTSSESFVGRGLAMAKVLGAIEAVASTEVGVLLTGATGTGKSTAAQLIHANSARSTRRLVAINCATLRPDRAVADLFGAAAQSYSGLTRDKPGLVEEAQGGTLFLDEVGELSADVQAQLLDFLQRGTYRRLGETRERRADVRILAATNKDLSGDTFRTDLLHRLSSFTIELPALHQRREDILPLADALMERLAVTMRVRPLPISPAACAWLEGQAWEGGVRELENCLVSGLLWARQQEAAALRVGHLQSAPAATVAPGPVSLSSAVDAFKRVYIRDALQRASGNRTRAAKELGVHRTTLYDLMESLSV